MSQTISLPKTVFENFIERLNRLETAVFGKKTTIIDEKITLTPIAKRRYKKMNKDIKEGKNIYTFNDSNSALKFLLSDKR